MKAGSIVSFLSLSLRIDKHLFECVSFATHLVHSRIMFVERQIGGILHPIPQS